MKEFIRALFVLLSLTTALTHTQAIQAATYYVDALNGSDTNKGKSAAKAWQTIAKINSLAKGALAPGDRVLLKRGLSWEEQLTVPGSGTVDNPITFGTYGSGANPVLKLMGVRHHAIVILNRSNIVIDGIDGEGPGGDNNDGIIDIQGTSSNIEIRNLEVRSGSVFGLHAGFGTTNITYRNVIARDNDNTGMYMNGTGQIIGGKSFDNATNNTIHTSDGAGIGINQGGPVLIEGVEVYNNGYPLGKSDFEISAADPSGSITIRGCHIHDAWHGGIQIADRNDRAADFHRIEYNIISGFGHTPYAEPVTGGVFAGIRIWHVSDVKIYNNVITNGGPHVTAWGILLKDDDPPGDPAANVDLKNNIFFHNTRADISIYGSSAVAGLASDHNNFFRTDGTVAWDWWPNQYTLLSDWQAGTGLDGASKTHDPDFVNPFPVSSEDFMLNESSPNRDIGYNTGATGDFASNPVPINSVQDIGAYEFQGPVDPPTDDIVTITKATYTARKNQLSVEASSTQGGNGILTVVGYGEMTYNSQKNKFTFSDNTVSAPVLTVTVTSSLGGTDTVDVIQR